MCNKCKKKCRGPTGPTGPTGLIGSTGAAGSIGPTGPTGTFPGTIESGSFNAIIVPHTGISYIETILGHYIKVNNIIFATIQGRNMTLNGNPDISVFLDGLPYTKTTSVLSGEGTATGSNPSTSGTLSGVCLANTDFLVDCNFTDSNISEGKIWENVAFSFSYVSV